MIHLLTLLHSVISLIKAHGSELQGPGEATSISQLTQDYNTCEYFIGTKALKMENVMTKEAQR